MSRSVLVLFTLLAARTAAADSSVTVLPNGITVVATASPVSEVLDRLARQTGMRVTYEGAVPRALVTTRIERATPAEAVLAILEGLDLGYALKMDATGSRVESLLMMGSSGATPARATAPTPVAKSFEPPVTPDDAAFDDTLEPAEEEPSPALPVPSEGGQKPEPPAPPGPGPGAIAERAYPASPFAPKVPSVVPTPPPPQEQKPKERATKPEA